MKKTVHPVIRMCLIWVMICGAYACSNDGKQEEDSGFINPFDTKYDIGIFDTNDIMDPDDALDDSSADATEELSDADGVGTDLPEDSEQPDEVSYPDEISWDTDIETDAGDPPITEYPFQTFGPMTLSMKGPMINNQYTQFRMAELSYWKHPKDQWEPLMDRIKEAGFNGIYTSACWARHEKQAGAWDFQTGNLDLAGWLQLTQAKGLYVYFAAGPWIDGEAGGCLPAWLASGAKSTPSPVADGKMALRVTDADYQTATNTWFDQLNAIAAQFQITSVPQGPIVFYQLESNYDAFYFLKEAEGRVLQEMLGAPMTPLNIGLYMAHLRDTVQADGITAPKVVALTGDFENGGRFLSGTGDTPGVYPAFTMTTDDTYQPVEQKLWTMRKEMRRTELHGQLYMAVPGIAVGVIPSAPQMARLLMAGADVVVVKDFVATLLPPDCAAVGSDYSGINFLKELDHARVSLGTIRRDVASPIALSGLPRPSYYAFKQLNYFLDTFGSGFAGKDLPYRTGPNITESVLKVKLSNPDTGALEDKWKWPAFGAAGGILEILGDHFADWFQTIEPIEPTGRATYFFDTNFGSIILHLVNLDDRKGDDNAHKRQDQITKVTVNGQKMPRHSNIVVPATEDLATGEGGLGWGSKFLVVNHTLGVGYPIMEYCSANVAAIREFNGRLLIVVHGKPKVKANGVHFTEPGEISFANIAGVPDVLHNSLPGGGIHTDPGGKLAVQFQHDETGYLLLQLPGAKQLMLMSTTTAMANTLQFTTLGNGTEVAVMGMDDVESISLVDGGLSILGSVSPPAEEYIVLTQMDPYEVVANNEEADCEYDDTIRALHCAAEPLPLPELEIPHGELYSRQDNYNGSLDNLGISEFPDAFATVAGNPISLADSQLAASHGIAWYATTIELGAVMPNQDGFLSVNGAADLVSIFINSIYIGSSTPAGNIPMNATDVAMGLPTAGFRVPAGVLVQGPNTIALRVVPLGRSPGFVPLVYASAPLLPPDLDSQASLIPHFAVEGLNPNHYKGIWGPTKITVGAMSVPIVGTWTISRGNADGMARTYGMLKGWHEMDSNDSTPGNFGFAWTGQITDDTPLILQDGQMAWLTTTFSSNSLGDNVGGLELELGGQSALAFVYFNGTFVGRWYADELSLSQGLYSKLVQGAGSRQILADRSSAHYGSASPDRIRLPLNLFNQGGNNRVTCLFVDISPSLAPDLVLPGVGSVAGTGQIHSFSVQWNQDRLAAGVEGQEASLMRHSTSLELLPPPPPEE